MKKISLEPRYVWIVSVSFLAGFLAGIMTANVLGMEYLSRAGILSDYFVRQYKYVEIDAVNLFFYILEKRMKWVLLLWVLGYTVVGFPSAVAFIAGLGFSAGTLLSVAVLKMGLQGIFFCVAAIFPQGLIYAPAWISFIYFIYKKSMFRMKMGRVLTGRNWDWNYVVIFFLMSLLIIAGIFLESHLNPWILKQFLKIF